MTIDADGNTIDYDGAYELYATFRCFEKNEAVYLGAEPIVDSGEIKFRSERCPFCGNNHWRAKEYKKYD